MKKMFFSSLIGFLIVYMAGGSILGEFSLYAQEIQTKHSVSLDEIRNEVQNAYNKRKQGIDTLESIISNSNVSKNLESLGFKITKVKTAIHSLTNEEIEYLNKSAQSINNRIIGGQKSQSSLVLAFVLFAVLVILILVSNKHRPANNQA